MGFVLSPFQEDKSLDQSHLKAFADDRGDPNVKICLG